MISFFLTSGEEERLRHQNNGAEDEEKQKHLHRMHFLILVVRLDLKLGEEKKWFLSVVEVVEAVLNATVVVIVVVVDVI